MTMLLCGYDYNKVRISYEIKIFIQNYNFDKYFDEYQFCKWYKFR